jgi:regulator of sirC expression with transglutaminase-like and TPR domain
VNGAQGAAALDPTYPDPFRQMGFLYYQSKQTEKSKEAFRKYLALKPDAPDARSVTAEGSAAVAMDELSPFSALSHLLRRG